jgi:hypothetical protein
MYLQISYFPFLASSLAIFVYLGRARGGVAYSTASGFAHGVRDRNGNGKVGC